MLLFGTLQGILVAITLSLVGLSSTGGKPAHSHVVGRKRGEDVLRPLRPSIQMTKPSKVMLILRPEGRLFFVNAQQVGDRIRTLATEQKPRVLMLDLSRVFDIEYSALQMIVEGERSLARAGIELWLAGLNPDVLAYIRTSGFADHLGPDRMFFNTRAGIRRYQDSLAAAPSKPAGGCGNRRDVSERARYKRVLALWVSLFSGCTGSSVAPTNERLPNLARVSRSTSSTLQML